MRWTFDVESTALYVYVREAPVAGQVELDDGTVVDVDELGGIVGFEVLRALASWRADQLIERFDLTEDERESVIFMADGSMVFGGHLGGRSFESPGRTDQPARVLALA